VRVIDLPDRAGSALKLNADALAQRVVGYLER